jgi:Holliday junction resolvase-like predicted endonuclease
VNLDLGLPILLALAALLLGLLVAGRKGNRATRRRNRMALDGEVIAEKLLKQQGYRVVERQVVGEWWMWVDDEAVDVQVRADFLVERRGRLYVAEVKTGRMVTDPAFPATRRQLLEYRMVFDVDGVLLVDAESHRVLQVDFPADRTDE